MPKLVPTRERIDGSCMDQSDSRQSNSVHFPLGRTNDHLRATNRD